MMDSQTEVQKPPSAQIVGQEFVKQYYTMLNAAPGHLHRFYSNNSSFIHGSADGRGEDQQAVTGQVEIHRKIMSLNFNNCHARICQVDSQSSVGGSVVVQVIGELSNDGQPMRRFVQTFVLAPQSTKKYYVHSDIFRYQDIYFPTAAADSGCAETEGEYVEEEAPGEDTEQLRYDGSGEQGEQVTDGVGCEEQEQEMAADSGCDVSDAAITPAHIAVAPEPDDGATGIDVEPAVACSETVEATPQQFVDNEKAEVDKNAPVEKQQPEEQQQPVEPAEKVAEPEPVQPAAPPKPMTWAAMASRNAGSQPVAPPAGSTATRAQSGVVRTQTAAAAEAKSEARQQPAQRPASNVEERAVNGRPMVNGGKDENNGGGVRRSVGGGFSPQVQIYPDSQQVFIGNLPQAFTDQEVVEFFEQYGKVLDFKINRKTGGGGGNNVGQKNFGFMSFDSADTVKKVLNARPIFMGKFRLNIEEKKPKEELAAARFSAPRYPGGNAGGGMQFVRSGDGAVPRRGGFNRPGDVRSNSSDDGRA